MHERYAHWHRVTCKGTECSRILIICYCTGIVLHLQETQLPPDTDLQSFAWYSIHMREAVILEAKFTKDFSRFKVEQKLFALRSGTPKAPKRYTVCEHIPNGDTWTRQVAI